jgi:serine/threonine-protein kinase
VSSVSTGEILNERYVVERELGAGGMAVVFSATHTVLGHRVAVKIMNESITGDAELRKRFLREARTAAKLQSAHVARVTDFGETVEGSPFIVMEYLEGQDLEAYLRRRGAVDPIIAIDFVLQVCEALGEAHGLGLIHRDISPKNIFVTKMADEKPLVKVLDFGLVKQRDSDHELTGRSTVFGSPAYLSPEQTRSSRDVDHRTDIWALGVCLYEMLTGRLPFSGKNVPDVYLKILREPVPPLGVPHLPRSLEDVVLKCLEKDREKRFADVGALAHALEQSLGHQSTSMRVQEVISRVHRRETMPTLLDGRDRRPTSTSWDSSGERREKRGGGGWIAVFAAVAMVIAIGVMQMPPRQASTAVAAPPPPAASSIDPTLATGPAPTPTPIVSSSALKPTKKLPAKPKPPQRR